MSTVDSNCYTRFKFDLGGALKYSVAAGYSILKIRIWSQYILILEVGKTKKIKIKFNAYK